MNGQLLRFCAAESRCNLLSLASQLFAADQFSLGPSAGSLGSFTGSFYLGTTPDYYAFPLNYLDPSKFVADTLASSAFVLVWYTIEDTLWHRVQVCGCAVLVWV